MCVRLRLGIMRCASFLDSSRGLGGIFARLRSWKMCEMRISRGLLFSLVFCSFHFFSLFDFDRLAITFTTP